MGKTRISLKKTQLDYVLGFLSFVAAAWLFYMFPTTGIKYGVLFMVLMFGLGCVLVGTGCYVLIRTLVITKKGVALFAIGPCYFDYYDWSAISSIEYIPTDLGTATNRYGNTVQYSECALLSFNLNNQTSKQIVFNRIKQRKKLFQAIVDCSPIDTHQSAAQHIIQTVDNVNETVEKRELKIAFNETMIQYLVIGGFLTIIIGLAYMLGVN